MYGGDKLEKAEERGKQQTNSIFDCFDLTIAVVYLSPQAKKKHVPLYIISICGFAFLAQKLKKSSRRSCSPTNVGDL